MHLWHSSGKFTPKVVKDLLFLLHRQPILKVPNAGSVKTNAKYHLAVAATAASEETKLAT
jgi:hypothetical protein